MNFFSNMQFLYCNIRTVWDLKSSGFFQAHIILFLVEKRNKPKALWRIFSCPISPSFFQSLPLWVVEEACPAKRKLAIDHKMWKRDRKKRNEERIIRLVRGSSLSKGVERKNNFGNSPLKGAGLESEHLS